ncbi:MAG TPA: amidohydrolase family protein, partial [Bacteroidota bacterium]|nr:amidohydrolase family protein [Bacteroidota bacterium]
LFLTIFLFTLPISAQRPLVLQGATMIDGVGRNPVPDAFIIVEHGMITGVGNKNSVIIPPDAVTIDLRGKFIMPGLVDTYTRFRSQRDLEEMFAWGVTSVNCVFASITEAKIYEAKATSDTNMLPRIFPTAPVFTAEHAWWSEKNGGDNSINRFPKTAEEARAQVRAVKALGIDRIMIVYDSMSWCRGNLKPLDHMQSDIMQALIDEATQQKMTTEIHSPEFNDAVAGQNAGVTAFIHGVITDRMSAPFVANFPVKGEFFVPTLCWYEFLGDRERFVQNIFSDARFRDTFSGDSITYYMSSEYIRANPDQCTDTAFVRSHIGILDENMITVVKNYGNITLATDLPMFSGIADHLELEYMVHGGLTPMQALAVGTNLSGQFLGASVGIIYAGNKADMLILDADPSRDIRNTRSLRTIIKNGKIYDRAELLKRLKQ